MKNISLPIAVANHQSKIWIFAIILSSEFATPVLSQAQALEKKVKFQRLESSKGLPNTYAVDIAQDRYGYTWIGTEDGLSRFDGDSFKAYRSGGTSTIVHWITSGEFPALIPIAISQEYMWMMIIICEPSASDDGEWRRCQD